MAEILLVAEGCKAERYELLLSQIQGLMEGESDKVAIMANIAAALKSTFGWFWVGFYRVEKDRQTLVLGPFQGPIACTRIPYEKGVCGAAWARNETLIVPDVNAFAGHIACSSQAQSEIVVPIRNSKGEVMAVLDIDSDRLNMFDDEDAKFLDQLAERLGVFFEW